MKHDMWSLSVKYFFHSRSAARITDIHLHAFTWQACCHVFANDVRSKL